MDSVIVHPQVPPVGEPLPALPAGKGPLPHVNVSLVGSQVPAAGEALTALSAAKRPLPCVCAGVHGELRGGEEALVAKLTGMQPDSRVAQQVSALVGRVGEALGAVRAGVRPSAPSAGSGGVAQGVGVSQCVGLWSERVSAAKSSEPPRVIDGASPSPVISGPPRGFSGGGWKLNLPSPPRPPAVALRRVLIGVVVFRLLVQVREGAAVVVVFVAGLVRDETRSEAGPVRAGAAAGRTGADGAVHLQVLQAGHPASCGA